jgi:hypothetical protein
MSRSRRPGYLLRRAHISPRKWTIKSLDLVEEDDGPALAAPHALRCNQEIGFVRVGFELPRAPVHRLDQRFAPRDTYHEARRFEDGARYGKTGNVAAGGTFA